MLKTDDQLDTESLASSLEESAEQTYEAESVSDPNAVLDEHVAPAAVEPAASTDEPASAAPNPDSAAAESANDAAARQQEESAPALLEATPIIDGSTTSGTGRTIELSEPATGKRLARVVLASEDDIETAVNAAGRALSLWRSTPFQQRAQTLRRLQKLLYEQASGIAELIAREQGKPFVEAMTMEVLPTLDHLKFMIQHAERYHTGLEVEPRHPYYAHKRSHYLYDAVGVIALVTPAPMPFSIPMIQVAAALAMGNSVVLKPSESAPLSGLRVGELCLEAGFPAGVVNVVPATPAETLQLVAHPRIDKVFFTGSLEAGQNVMATAGCAPRPVVLSLGGNHPSIVAADADLSRAAKGVVWGALANAGQNCGSIQRVYVEEAIASQFLELVLEEVDRLKVGNPLASGIDVGPMQCPQRRQQVHTRVKEAVDRGARLLRGGSMPQGPGLFYPPTVLHDPPADCALMREETLGPVIPIVTTNNLERAILLANDTDYALTASGWTRSAESAERIMVGVQAGVVTINDALYSFGEPASTWSGDKKSGIGQNHGRPGLREMSRQRFASFDASPAEAPLFAYPYDEPQIQLTRRALDHLHAPGKFSRLRGLLRLIRLPRFRARVPVRSVLLPAKKRPH